MATRLIDASYHFLGWKNGTLQALQWPRRGAVNPDLLPSPFPITSVVVLATQVGPFFDYTKIPKLLVDATSEQARELLLLDRTAAPEGEGLKRLYLTGVVSLFFDPADRLPVISHVTQTMLSKLGSLIVAASGSAKLVRT